MSNRDKYVPGPAAGAEVLERLLAGEPVGRIVGAEALKLDGWQRLTGEYARQFGVETPLGRPTPRRGEA